MVLTRDTHSIFTEFAIFCIFGSAILYTDPIPALHMAFSGLRLIAVAYALMLVFANRRIGAYSWLVAFFFTSLGIITYMHRGAMNTYTSYVLNTMAVCVLIYYSLLRSIPNTVDMMARIFAILIYVNFIFTVLPLRGILGDGYPLGSNHNQVGSTLLCAIITHSVAYKMGLRKFIPTVLLCIVCSITPLIFGSMTSAVGCTLASVFFLVPNKKLRRTIIVTFVTFYLVFQTFVVFMQGDLSENKQISYFVEEVLGKDLTFTDRARVWIAVIDYIQDSPQTGYGIRSVEWFEDTFRVKTTHNVFLQIMMFGGYIQLSFFLLLIGISAWRSFKNRTPITDSLQFGVSVFFFMMMMENYSIVLICYVLCMLFYAPELSSTLTINTTTDENDSLQYHYSAL